MGVAHPLPKTKGILSRIGEIIVGTDREGREKKRDAMSIPFPEVIRQHILHRVSLEVADWWLLVAEQPEILVGIHVVVAYGQRQVIRNAIVFNHEGKIIHLIFVPHLSLNRLKLVINGRLCARSQTA